MCLFHFESCSSSTYFPFQVLTCSACTQAEVIEAWSDIPESVRSEVGSPYGFLCDNPRRLLVSSSLQCLSAKPRSIRSKLQLAYSPAKPCRYPRKCLVPKRSGGYQPSLCVQLSQPSALLLGYSNLDSAVLLKHRSIATATPRCLIMQHGNQEWTWTALPPSSQSEKLGRSLWISQFPQKGLGQLFWALNGCKQLFAARHHSRGYNEGHTAVAKHSNCHYTAPAQVRTLVHKEPCN